MRRLYTLAMLATLFAVSASAQTLPRPKTPAGPPQDGQTYVLVSAYSPTRHYSNLTGWDNAVYLTADVDFEFTAVLNEDNTWSFIRQDGENNYYMITRLNDGNVRWNSTDPVKWYVEAGDFDGFVRLKAGEGNGEPQQLYYVHLNGGGEYVVVSCPGYGWYPDFAGGRVPNPDESADDEYLKDDTGRYILADKTSENWAFVSKEDWPAFRALYIAREDILLLQGDEYSFPEYADGFEATLNATLTLYNDGDLSAETAENIHEMITAKISFYELLLEAYDKDADAALENAITLAQQAFDTLTDADAVKEATEALRQAIIDFDQGTGDYTALIINPSFEDLSAQGGHMTSGIAAPPVGWNVFIKGQQVTTATEVSAAGIQNWHGANDDCDGDKDGYYGFGIWTPAVPDYQISQTVEGLDCGTYTVTASVMVGANGNGSRRTTQRLFGNFNTAYFGYEYDYDATQLETGEVRSFANLEEFVTDRTLQQMSVRAYVYNGKLTFGLRTDGNIKAALRETSNASGGDGWFKLDNFHIYKEGYFGSEAAEVANTFLNMYKSYQGQYMYKELISEIQGVVGSYTEVKAETPMEQINAQIESLSTHLELLDRVKSCIAAYDRLSEAIEDGYTQLNDYIYNKGADEYEEMLEDADYGYQNGEYTEEEIDNVIKALEAKLDEVIKAGVAVGDYINVIKNPSFEDLSAQNNMVSGGQVNPPAGWTLLLNGIAVETVADYSGTGANMNWCAINNGDNINAVDELGNTWTHQYSDGTHLWGIWADRVPEVELSQRITGLPAGTYVLECDMVVPNDWSGYSVTTQRIFANHYVQMFSNEAHYSELNETDDMAFARTMDTRWHPEAEIKHLQYAGWQSNEVEGYNDDATDVPSTLCPYHMALTFGVDESGEAYIGFRTNNVAMDGTARKRAADGWFKLDNFKLFYQSTDIPTAIDAQEISGAITKMVGRQYFSTDGRQLAQPQQGITIVKNIMSDGTIKTVKVMK